MRAALVLALVAAGGFALAWAGAPPAPRAVDAPAQAVAARDGTLLGALEDGGTAHLVRLHPGTLRSAARPLRLVEELFGDFAVSPDGRVMAIGGMLHSRIQFVDLRHWRSLGTMRLPGPRPGGYGGAIGLTWPSERRLVVVSGAPWRNAAPLVVDPVARRVVRRSSWRGVPLQWDARGGRVVVLSSPRYPAGPAPATLVSYDARGRLREVRLRRILAGSGEAGPGPARDLTPALAVDWRARRAYVVSTDGVLAAEVDLRRGRVEYHELTEPRTALERLHELIEPAAHAKGGPVEVRMRFAEVLPNGAIAVTGEDRPATDPPHLSRALPFGLRLIDPRTWTIRMVDPEPQDFTVAGGTVLAHRFAVAQGVLEGIGVRAYDTAGERRWSRFDGAKAIVRGAAGRHAYVEARKAGRRRIHVIELATGRTVRTLGARGVRVLEP